MKSVLLVLLLALVTDLAAKEPPRMSSEALKVVRAAHFDRIRDATREDIATALDTEKRGLPVTMTAIGVGQAVGILSPPPGLSAGGAAGLSFVSAVISGLPEGYPELSPRLLVWMPLELAPTREAARDVLRDILLKAVAETQPESTVRFVHEGRKSKMQSHLAFDSPQCEGECRMVALGLQDFVLPKKVKTPDILGGEGKRYAWGHPYKQGDGLLTDYPWSNPALTSQQRQAFLVNFSSKVPPWIFIYVPASELIAPYAQLLHQGKVLFFIEPGADIPTLASEAQPNK